MVEPVIFVSEREFGNGSLQKILLTIDIGEKYNMLDLLSNNSKFLEVNSTCIVKIDSLNGLPVIICDESAVNAAGISVITCHVKAFESALTDRTKTFNKATMLPAIVEKCMTLFPTATQSHIVYLLEFLVGEYGDYVNKSLSVKVDFRPVNINHIRLAETREAINKMNLSASVTARYVSQGQNITLKQELPLDRFFIPLPKYEDFKGGSLFSQKVIPDIRKTFMPFSHKAYYSPIWKDLVNKSTFDRKQVLLAANKIKGGLSFDENDMNTWVDYPESHVLGSDENDDVPIADNEIEWYNAFLKFIRVDLVESFGEDIAEDMFQTGGLSEQMENFYESILESVLILNWSCAGQFPVFKHDPMDEEDDDSESEDERSEYEATFYAVNAGIEEFKVGIDGISMIRDFIKRVAVGGKIGEGQGCKTYAEALIKLARWGDRKPANLKLEGEKSLLSLTTCRFMNEVVDFEKMTVKKINGRLLSLNGYVTINWVIQDEEYKKEYGVDGKIAVPVGVMASKYFEGKENLRQYVYLSMSDVISEYIAGNQFIDGIELGSDGKFNVALDDSSLCVDLDFVKKETMAGKGSSLYISKRLEEVARDMGQKANLMTELMVLARASVATGGSPMAWFKTLVLENRNHLAQIVKDGYMDAKSAAQFRILKHILPLYLRYSDEARKQEINPDFRYGMYFDIFHTLSESMSIRNPMEFYMIGEQRAATVPNLSSFGAVDTKTKNIKVDLKSTENDRKMPSKESDLGTAANAKDFVANTPAQRYVVSDTKGIKDVYPVMYHVQSKGMPPSKMVIGYYGRLLADIKGKPIPIGVFFSPQEVPSDVKINENTPCDLSQFAIHLLRIVGEIIADIEPKQKPVMFSSLNTVGAILSEVMRKR